MARKRQARVRKRPARPQRTTSARGRSTTSQDFDPDYTHIIQDLRRIGLLTGAFLIILIALTFILR